jgi:hypothetical protein
LLPNRSLFLFPFFLKAKVDNLLLSSLKKIHLTTFWQYFAALPSLILILFFFSQMATSIHPPLKELGYTALTLLVFYYHHKLDTSHPSPPHCSGNHFLRDPVFLQLTQIRLCHNSSKNNLRLLALATPQKSC